MSYCLVLSTCESREDAHRVAEKLLSTKLAACVQIDRIESLYRWKGSVESAEEYRLMIKTRENCYAKIEKKLLEIHRYEIPQIVKLPIETGLSSYLEWVDENVGA